MRIQSLPNSLTSAWSRLDTGSSKNTDGYSKPDGTPIDVTDELILSGEEPATEPAVYRHELFSTQPGGDVKVEDVRKQFEQRLGGLEAQLVRLFAQNGIDASTQIPLRTATDGRVIVAGDHPQKTEIEKLFADDRSLRDDFVATQAQAEFIRAADEAIAFQAAYRKDPKKALEEFRHLFQERHDDFTLSFQDGKAKVSFGPQT